MVGAEDPLHEEPEVVRIDLVPELAPADPLVQWLECLDSLGRHHDELAREVAPYESLPFQVPLVPADGPTLPRCGPSVPPQTPRCRAGSLGDETPVATVTRPPPRRWRRGTGNDRTDSEEGVMVAKEAPRPLAGALSTQREELATLADRTAAVAGDLGMDGEGSASRLDELAETVRAERFRVMFVGELKEGKSALINALLDVDLLPVHDVPTTGLPTVIGYAEVPTVILHRLPAEPGGPAEAVVSDLEHFRRWVRIDDSGPNPYQSAELRWPIDMLRGGVEIMDAPGLNEDDRREAVTLAWLHRADALVMVMNARGAFSLSERAYLDRVMAGLGHAASQTLFFAFTMFDLIRDRTEVVERNMALARTYVGAVADRRAFHTSALSPAGSDPDAAGDPGVRQLHAALGQFLAGDRLRLKVERPAEQLRNTILELRARLPERRAMLERDKDELEASYRREEDRLADLSRRRAAIADAVSRWAAETERGVADRARSLYEDAARQAPAWAMGMDRRTRLSLNPWEAQREAKAAVAELAAGLSTQMTAAFARWRDEALAAYLADRIEMLQPTLDDQLEGYLIDVEGIRSTLREPPGREPLLSGGEGPDPVDRLLGTVGGLLLPGSTVAGARFGTEGFLRTMVPSIAVWFVGTFVFALNPLTIAAALLGANVLDAFGTRRWAERRLAERAGEEYARHLRGLAESAATGIAATVRAGLDEEAAGLEQALADEVAALRTDVESVLATLSQGSASVEGERARLEGAEATLNEVEQGLVWLRASLGG